MKKTIAGGVWPVMITPFTEDNRIDYDAVLRIIEWYDKNGVDGIFAVCQSSEMFELSPQERVELAKFIINNTPKHMGVIASGHCAEKVEDQIREAQTVIDAGVDAYVFISNQFAKENESEDVAKKILNIFWITLMEICSVFMSARHHTRDFFHQSFSNGVQRLRNLHS